MLHHRLSVSCVRPLPAHVPSLSRTRLSVVVRLIHICTEIHQQLHGVRAPIQSGLHECCPTTSV